jgi:acyl-coenzyme A thioesterase PaaI-like protein
MTARSSLEIAELQRRTLNFNRRSEILWFGLEGALLSGGLATVKFKQGHAGVLGGGGVAAINGGVIAAGFDAACVLAAVGEYDTETLVTLTLNLQFLRLARPELGLRYAAKVTKRARNVCFVSAELLQENQAGQAPIAIAHATLAPVYRSAASTSLTVA